MADILMYGSEQIGVAGPADASELPYDNTTSGLTADNVQDAVDELEEKLTLGGWVGIDTAITSRKAWVRKIGHLVEFYFFADSAVSTNIELCTLPEKYRCNSPISPWAFFVRNYNPNGDCYLTINDSGVINLSTSTAQWKLFHTVWLSLTDN